MTGVSLLAGSATYNSGLFYDFSLACCSTMESPLQATFAENYGGGSPERVLLRDPLNVDWTYPGWEPLTFDIPFWHDGSSHLLLEFQWQGDDNRSAYAVGWYPTGGGRVLDGAVGPPTGDLRSYMNSLRIHYDQGTPSPTPPTATPEPTGTGTPTPTATVPPTATFTLPPTASPTASPTSAPTAPPSPTPRPLGVRLELPGRVHPGEPFWITASLDNPGEPRPDVPVVMVLDVHGETWFWPSWSPYEPSASTGFDHGTMDLPTGTTRLVVLPALPWPETGDQAMEGLFLYGALLTPDLTGIDGGWDSREWAFGPR